MKTPSIKNTSLFEKKALVLTGLGVLVGIGEALVYYNLGQSAGGSFKFKLLPRKEFYKTMGVVAITSILTTILFKVVENSLDKKSNENSVMA